MTSHRKLWQHPDTSGKRVEITIIRSNTPSAGKNDQSIVVKYDSRRLLRVAASQKALIY